jgi:DNA gyrase inhibitor GyrI
MTDTMFERMAKAIALSDGYSLEQLNQYRDDPRVCPMPEYRANVRAVLQAIREPDDAMEEAGFTALKAEQSANTPGGTCAVVFTAMIDSILSQSQEGNHP